MNMQELKQLIYKGEKVDIECKEAESNVPRSAYESYSAFANTKGGYIILGVKEDKKKRLPKERFMIQGIQNAKKQVEDLWNTINSSKVNRNILKDEDVLIVEEFGVSLIVIKVPRADYKMRLIYVGENPYKGTFKRNNEGDYHATEHEIRGMIRDQNPDGNDGMILEYYTMDDIDKETLRKYRQIFEIRNDGHVWNALDDKSFLEKLGGYRKDRREGKEGLTLAEGWVQPELIEDTALNQVTLYLKMISEHGEQSTKKTAEKSAESAETQEASLSERQKQILACMELEVLYKTEEIAEKIGLKGPRTRQLLNELVAMGRLTCTAATKNRRYIRIE